MNISLYLILGVSFLSILILTTKRKIDNKNSTEKIFKNKIYKNKKIMNLLIYLISFLLIIIYIMFCFEHYYINKNIYLFFSICLVFCAIARFLFLFNIKEINKDINLILSTDKYIISSFILWLFYVIMVFN